MAGFIGCNGAATTTNNLNSPTSFLYNFATAIQGFDAKSTTAWSPVIDTAITSPLGGSDIISIRRADDKSFTVTAQSTVSEEISLDATATSNNLIIAGVNSCSTIVVSNCTSADFFQVTAISGSQMSHSSSGCSSAPGPGNSVATLSKTYVGGQVYAINTISFYVRTNPSNQPSLYRRVGANSAEELVEGIESMQILYGVDNDTIAGANYYVTADLVNNWSKVVSIRVTLTVRTIDANLTSATSDGRIRRVFTSTITLRNRLV
jgi:type IV pilus assembly protein PilW